MSVDQNALEKEMLDQALGYVVHFLLAEHFKAQPDPQAAAQQFLAEAEHVGDRITFPQFDAGTSDAAAQLFRDSLVRIGCRAAALATGQSFDHTAYLRRHAP